MVVKFMPVVYFDEGGNTGPDLLNLEQPVFVLASTDITEQEALTLLEPFHSTQASEVKYNRGKKTTAGINRLARFFREELISKDRVKVVVYHKEYMIVTKIVDLLIEPLANKCGLDLYQQGANIATTNLHYYCMPTFCGRARFKRLLTAFTRMFRQRSMEAIQSFYKAARQMHQKCTNADYKADLSPILLSEEIIGHILAANDARTLNPALPCFFHLCTLWGDALKSEFLAVHDSSNSVAKEKETLALLIDKSRPRVLLGYDRRKYELPLRATRIEFADSKDHNSLQVVDLIAGAVADLLASKTGKRLDHAHRQMLEKSHVEQLVVGALWPHAEVDPKNLGTSEIGGINPVDGFVDWTQNKLK